MARIGFIGLGHMGLPMAMHLVQAGHEVTGFDLETEPLERLKAVGGHTVSDKLLAARDQEVVITMLQTGEQVRSVCLGETGIFSVMSRSTLFIDCSTIDVEAAQEINQKAEDMGLAALDAPVSGGVAAAEEARLTFMVGGREGAYQLAEPVLNCMGKQVMHMGASGHGVAAKICNNMILGISMVAVSEAFLLAEKLGLDAKKLHDIVTKSSGNCWVMDTYVPVPGVLPHVPANQAYAPGFTSAMMQKDLRLAVDASETQGIKAGMGAFALALYEEASDSIDALDFSAIFKFIQTQSIK